MMQVLFGFTHRLMEMAKQCHQGADGHHVQHTSATTSYQQTTPSQGIVVGHEKRCTDFSNRIAADAGHVREQAGRLLREVSGG